MQTLLLEFFLLLPFISGAALIHLIAERRKWAFTVCDKLISGALLGNFLLIAPSILVGFFSNYLNRMFELYSLLGISALILGLFQVLRWKKRTILSNMRFDNLRFKVYALPILLFALFTLFYHTLYLEYDALYVFLPYAKSIALTGSMKYNVYSQSTLSTGMPPVQPVIFAWAFKTINDLDAMGIHNDLNMYDVLRPIPVAYFLLTALAVYLVARETMRNKYAFLSIILFVSFPSTILTLSAFSYYLEIGVVFYLISTIFCLTRALKTDKSIWFLFTGVASSLLLLVKELSVFVLPIVFSMFVLSSASRYRRAAFAMVSTLPFYLLFVWDLYISPISDVGWVLMRQLPIFALSTLLYYLSKAQKITYKTLTRKKLILFLFPFVPSVVFFLRGIVFLGSVYSVFCWEPSYTEAVRLFYTATGTSRTIDVISFFRWDIPFLSLSLGFFYIIPILFTIAFLFKGRDKAIHPVNYLMVIMLLTLLGTMSFTTVGSEAESRRMYNFAPILAVFAANGLMFFENFLRDRNFIHLWTLFNSLFLCYIWRYRFPFQTLLELSYLKTNIGLATTLDIAFLLLLFGGLLLALSLRNKDLGPLRARAEPMSEIRIHERRRVTASLVAKKDVESSRSRIGKKTALFLVLASWSFLIASMIPIWPEMIGKGLRLQHQVHMPTWENGILPVCYHYVQFINDYYVTASFGGNALRYFANRSVIDLTNEIGVESMQNILTINASGELLQALNNSNIRYFLIPRSNSSFYHLYLSFQQSFYLFRLIEDDSHFSLIREFPYYKLFKFVEKGT